MIEFTISAFERFSASRLDMLLQEKALAHNVELLPIYDKHYTGSKSINFLTRYEIRYPYSVETSPNGNQVYRVDQPEILKGA